MKLLHSTDLLVLVGHPPIEQFSDMKKNRKIEHKWDEIISQNR